MVLKPWSNENESGRELKDEIWHESCNSHCSVKRPTRVDWNCSVFGHFIVRVLSTLSAQLSWAVIRRWELAVERISESRILMTLHVVAKDSNSELIVRRGLGNILIFWNLDILEMYLKLCFLYKPINVNFTQQNDKLSSSCHFNC